ncbi:hypothetical protein LINGRAHAP2_LOCUS34839 [Linum grandiflorum]|jgi:NAD(P)-dependent dehydrogenase (short-subunit alcohol dehydrogenase family)
MLGP